MIFRGLGSIFVREAGCKKPNSIKILRKHRNWKPFLAVTEVRFYDRGPRTVDRDSYAWHTMQRVTRMVGGTHTLEANFGSRRTSFEALRVRLPTESHLVHLLATACHTARTAVGRCQRRAMLPVENFLVEIFPKPAIIITGEHNN